MECPKCESKAIVADKKVYRQAAGEPISEVRVYVCSNMQCLNSFTYRNTYLGQRDRLDAERFIRAYERRRENSNQVGLFDDE